MYVKELYKRKKEFLDLRVEYAGKKINNARTTIGPKNFKYEVLEKIEYENIIKDLNLAH